MNLQFKRENNQWTTVCIEHMPMVELHFHWKEPVRLVMRMDDDEHVITGPRRVDALEEFFRAHARNIALFIKGKLETDGYGTITDCCEISIEIRDLGHCIGLLAGDTSFMETITETVPPFTYKDIEQNAWALAHAVEARIAEWEKNR